MSDTKGRKILIIRSISNSLITSTVEAPDHTITETKTNTDTGQWKYGLVEEIKVKYGATVFAKTKIDWDPGVTGGSYRVSQVRVTDVAAGLTRATVFSYDDSQPFNNVAVARERGFSTDESVSLTELRKS